MPDPQRVTVISWNAGEKNPDFLANLAKMLNEAVSGSKLVICLQEVAKLRFPELLEFAKAHGFEVSHGIDKMRQQADGVLRDCYNVVLSHFPITRSQTWRMSDTPTRPLLVRANIWALRTAGKIPVLCDKVPTWDDTAVASDGLRLNIDVGDGKRLRIFNAHLSLTSPDIRRHEFNSLIHRLDGAWPAVICGDFNVLEGTFGRAVNFLIGGSIPYALWRSERTEFDELLALLELNNPLAGKDTRKGGQLDHILHRSDLQCVDTDVLQKYGSDHNAISATFELA